jgi:hypothetical protein
MQLCKILLIFNEINYLELIISKHFNRRNYGKTQQEQDKRSCRNHQ